MNVVAAATAVAPHWETQERAPRGTAEGGRWIDEDFPLISPDAAASMRLLEMLGGREWSDDQRQALYDYTYEPDINRYLREQATDEPDYDRQAAVMDTAMRPTTRAFTVVRGADWESLGTDDIDEIQTMVGREFVDRGFLSTSIDTTRAFPGPVQYVIRVPVGMYGAYLPTTSAIPDEHEFLLGRMSRLLLEDVEEVPGGGVKVTWRGIP